MEEEEKKMKKKKQHLQLDSERTTESHRASSARLVGEDKERIMPLLLQPQVGTKTNLRISCRSIEGLAHRNHNQLISKIHNISS